MPTQQYSVQQPPIENIFTWINSGEIAIPEIQRPFVWNSTKVRDFLDSLYHGYPVGFLIAWKNPDVKLKDGTTSTGKKILIDGQQRVTALRASILGQEIVDKNYQQKRITISFHPSMNKFEVYNSAIAKNPLWIPDISRVFAPGTSLFNLVSDYCERNHGANKDDIFLSLEKLRGITSNQIGLILLDSELDINTVTEIFVRVNSEGVPLSQADFAMSKIAVNENHNGNVLRKAIDYFCHLSVAPEFYNNIKKDQEFSASEFLPRMAWLKDDNNDLYEPSYTDMLRVAFASEFKRGRLEDLVALLSGRNFQTRSYEETIVEESFSNLKNGILSFMNENQYTRFIMIIRSAGFLNASMIGSKNALNFAYILYLFLRKQNVPNNEIEWQVRRWFVMSILTGRYSANPEGAIDYDIRQIHSQGIDKYADAVIHGELSDNFWDVQLPQDLETSVVTSPYFRAFQAAQIKLGDKGFLSKDISVRELIEVRSNVHHIFPRDYLKRHGLSRGQYNQVANYVITQNEINIAIGNKEPSVYFKQALEQCQGGEKLYGNITDLDQLRDNYEMNCIPDGIENMTIEDYDDFLIKRRKLMAKKIKEYFKVL